MTTPEIKDLPASINLTQENIVHIDRYRREVTVKYRPASGKAYPSRAELNVTAWRWENLKLYTPEGRHIASLEKQPDNAWSYRLTPLGQTVSATVTGSAGTQGAIAFNPPITDVEKAMARLSELFREYASLEWQESELDDKVIGYLDHYVDYNAILDLLPVGNPEWVGTPQLSGRSRAVLAQLICAELAPEGNRIFEEMMARLSQQVARAVAQPHIAELIQAELKADGLNATPAAAR